MVEITKPQTFEKFKGKVESIKIEPSGLKDQEDKERYHLVIEPLDVEIKGKTGRIHEWLPVSDMATDTSVPEGSILHRYMQELSDIGIDDKELVNDVFQQMVGKTFLFRKKELGRAFKGHEAKKYWVPKEMIEDED